MKKRKTVEPIIINKEPLATTTIGKMETKENGPIFAVIGIGIFIVCIFFLPQISSWINNLRNPSSPITGGTITTPENPSQSEEEKENVNYYEFKSDLLVTLNGYYFKDFVINENNKTFNFFVQNQNGDDNLFKEKNYYLELYTKDELLLQRVRLAPSKMVNNSTFSFSLDSNINTNDIYKLAFVTKEDEDYPAVDLQNDKNNNPILTCTLNNETITYTFKNEEDIYKLKSINEVNSFKSTDPNYSNYLTSYTILADSYKSVNGVDAHLNPIATGFTFDTTIDLEKVDNTNYTKTFTKEIYYSKDTEARIIAFELSSSGYTCS